MLSYAKMNAMKSINLICHPQWMIDELTMVKSFKVHPSFGFDVPDYDASTGWWMPQQVASDVTRHTIEKHSTPLHLIAPGVNWLPNVPTEFSGRTVANHRLGAVREDPKTFDTGWWKAAEAKIDSLPNSYRTIEQLIEDTDSLPGDVILQFTETTLNIVSEYRFWVLNETIRTGSLYLKTDDVSTITYYDGAEAEEEEYTAAMVFAENVLKSVNHPKAFVLDVAKTAEGDHVILEANPAWCSAWYGADIEKVAEVAYTASTTTDNTWPWKPDFYHVQKTYRKPVMR